MFREFQHIERIGFLLLFGSLTGLIFPGCHKEDQWSVVQYPSAAQRAERRPIDHNSSPQSTIPSRVPHSPPSSTQVESAPSTPNTQAEAPPPSPASQPPAAPAPSTPPTGGTNLIQEKPSHPWFPPYVPGDFKAKKDTFNCLENRTWRGGKGEPAIFLSPNNGEQILGCDNLGAATYKVGTDFYLLRWRPEDFPIHFHISLASPSNIDTRTAVELAAEQINQGALKSGVLDYLNLNEIIVIEPGYTSKTADISKSDGESVIQFVEDQTPGKKLKSVTYPWITNKQPYSLIETDIRIPATLANSAYVAIHEMLHALGFTHNFVGAQYGSPMDYPHEGVIPKAELGPYDLEVLQYLYTPQTEGFHRWNLKRSDPGREK